MSGLLRVPALALAVFIPSCLISYVTLGHQAMGRTDLGPIETYTLAGFGRDAAILSLPVCLLAACTIALLRRCAPAREHCTRALCVALPAFLAGTFLLNWDLQRFFGSTVTVDDALAELGSDAGWLLLGLLLTAAGVRGATRIGGHDALQTS